MVVYFKIKMKKLLILIYMGLCFISCSKAQNEKEPAMKEYQAKDIIKLINKGKPVLFANAIIKGDLNFSDVDDVDMIAPTTFVAHISSSIYFQSCVFLGEVKGYGQKTISGKNLPIKNRFERDVHFMDCDFRKNVDFSEAEFYASVSFDKTVFRGEALLNNILCIGEKNKWWEMEADSTFMMCGATFRGDLNMMDAKFKQEVSFQGLTINNLQISNLYTAGRFDLSLSTINGFFIFNYGTCEDITSLAFSKFAGRVDIVGTTFNAECDMEESAFYGNVKFDRTNFKGGIKTNETHFLLSPKREGTLFKNDSIPSFNAF